MDERVPQVDFSDVRRVLGGGAFLILLAAILLLAVLASTFRIGKISGEQVGVLLNKVSGKTTVITQSGVRIYNGITNDLFVLDKTLQTLEMTEALGKGERKGKDDLKIKTVDGSDVYVDLKVQYRIRPEDADLVIATSGPGENYKKKWARDYVRAISRNFLGELTTEEFYDSSKRDAKTVLARNNANERLEPFGITIDSIVIPKKPHFYDAYEAMIKRKKLADQAVLEEEAKALAAKQKQITLVVEETNKKNVAVETFKGEMEQKVIQAGAEGERARKGADGYFDKVTIGADANLYQMQKEAESVLAKKSAEAKGIEILKKALEGEGGWNMVKLEYARKLKGIMITGKPFTIQAHTERFEHLDAAAAEGRGKQLPVGGRN